MVTWHQCVLIQFGLFDFIFMPSIFQNMAFMTLATWLYLNAWWVNMLVRSDLFVWSSFSGKGEECIPQTWDMYHEKWAFYLNLSDTMDIYPTYSWRWGFMVIFWNFAGVPFVSMPSAGYWHGTNTPFRRLTSTRSFTWPRTIPRNTVFQHPHTSFFSALCSPHITCTFLPSCRSHWCWFDL